jgi:hypothetical protein
MQQLSDAELVRIAMGSQLTMLLPRRNLRNFGANVVTHVRTVTLSQIVHFRCSAHE